MKHISLIIVVLVSLLFLTAGCSSSGGDDAPTAKYQPETNDNPYPDSNPESDDPWAGYDGLLAGFGKAVIVDVGDEVDGYMIAGFGLLPWERKCWGVHDPVYAIACVLRNGKDRIAIVAVDAFNIRLQDTDEIKKAVASLGITKVLVHAVHNHEVPDNNGMWTFLKIVGKEGKLRFRQLINDAAIEAIKEASKNIEPAEMYIGEDLEHDRYQVQDPTRITDEELYGKFKATEIDGRTIIRPNVLGFSDQRPPFAPDTGIRIVVFKEKGGTRVIGTMVNWGMHIETIWKWNQLVSADFAGYMRDALDERLGGTTMFITGNVGVVTTPIDDPVYVYHPSTGLYEDKLFTSVVTYKGKEYVGHEYSPGIFKSNDNVDNFEKAWAQGNLLADIVYEAVESDRLEMNPNPEISLYTRREKLEIQNPKFMLVWNLGIMDRDGFKEKVIENGKEVEKNYTMTEVNLAVIGDLWILAVPGELYPEIASGNILVPEGRDYVDVKTAVEVPPLRSVMKGKINMFMNLGNDHLGYIIPKTQWDEEKPLALGYSDRMPYGEENSAGPDAAGAIHRWSMELINMAQK
jgi:hypothetical protein